MAFKRALVVDDSRTARQSLAKLLAQYDLEVAFAETGEEALTFLHHELVDVIFMDHTMPGMDGLEAVSAIKGNPRTATIPVMMYTTKEGEVYVSQARALGAVGVLPKQVQPGVLWDMLNKLGLVVDRRRDDVPAPPDVPRRRFTDLVDDVDREYEQRAMGASVRALVTRVLEEQHLKLRSDIVASQRRFAEQVAAEILERQAPATPLPPPPSPDRFRRVAAATTAALALGIVLMGIFTWQLMASRDAARLELTRLTNATRSELDALYRQNDGLSASLERRHDEALARLAHAVQALEWAINQGAPVAFDELPFNDASADRLLELLERLAALDFRGRVLLTAELAPFCLARDPYGALTLAPSGLPIDACDLLGHPLQEERSPSSLQSITFAAAMEDAERYPDIAVELAFRSPFDSMETLPFTADDAAEWNRRASSLNRVRFTLIPHAGSAVAGLPPAGR